MKNLIKSLFFMLILTVSFESVNAAIWEDNQAWSVQYEQKYMEWMQSSAVREKMFNDPASPYYGISTDCADTAYAFRAIFAFENKLPFVITNPSGARTPSQTLNNRTNKFDSYGTETQRLIALIEEIGGSVGTENLTRLDTFPTAIKSISPGTLFTLKIKARLGKFIRHTYNIKAINPIGTFDVIYSTQANHEKRGDLLRRRDREFENLPNDPWGFRKFRWPEHLGKELSAIPAALGPSNEQYALAATMDARTFFQYVTKTLATSNETAGERLSRLFTSTCEESTARIMYVNEGLDYLKSIGDRCMDYEEFDAYSTPSRDAALKEMFERLKIAHADAIRSGNGDPRIIGFGDLIFKGKGTPAVQADLKAVCPIAYRPGIVIDLKTLWYRIENEKLSSHPNDVVELRWGEGGQPKTKCKRWYKRA